MLWMVSCSYEIESLDYLDGKLAYDGTQVAICHRDWLKPNFKTETLTPFAKLNCRIFTYFIFLFIIFD